MEEGKRFLSKMPRSGRFLLIADNDTDGIVAAHLFARYFHRRSPYSSLLIVVTNRDRVLDVLREHPGYVPVFLDITPSEDVVKYLEAEKRTAYVIDHHPCSCDGPLVLFNPHLLNIPNASRYNTGFLVYVLFRDEVVKGGDLWKVAVSSFGDSSYDFLKPHFYGLDKRTVELASHMVGSGEEKDLPLIFSVLEEAEGIDDFVGNEDLLRLKEDFERKLKELVSNIEEYSLYRDETLLVALLPPEFSRFKSAVATVYSKRNPDLVVAVGTKENGWYSFSLRCQNAQERRMHLGVFARNEARKWGTRGGGHAPAAGLRVPLEALDEFVADIRTYVMEKID